MFEAGTSGQEAGSYLEWHRPSLFLQFANVPALPHQSQRPPLTNGSDPDTEASAYEVDLSSLTVFALSVLPLHTK